jgi:hypothetical protein
LADEPLHDVGRGIASHHDNRRASDVHQPRNMVLDERCPFDLDQGLRAAHRRPTPAASTMPESVVIPEATS